MNIEERKKKTNAMLILLEYSLLLSIDQKALIAQNVDKFTDEQILNIGKVLAVEHYKREELDSAMENSIKDMLVKIQSAE